MFEYGRKTEVDLEVMRLISMHKDVDEDRSVFKAPAPGKKLDVRLVAHEEPSIKFALSINEGKRNSSLSVEIVSTRKTTMQTRAASFPLLRLDIDDRGIHRNPDGTIVNGSHLHVFSPKYGDKVAYPLENQDIICIDSEDAMQEVFEKFRNVCGITERLIIEWGLDL